MIKAAIVGLGWWGKTLVESVAGQSDAIRFVAATTRTISPEAEAFAAEHDLRLVDGTRSSSPTPTSTRSCSPRPTPSTRAGDRGRGGRQARLLREAVRAHEGRRPRRRSRRAKGRGHARPRLQPPLPSRDDEAARADRGRASSASIMHVEATMTFPNALIPQAQPVARQARRDAVRRAHADGRPRDRRHDRPLRPDRPGVLPELSPRRRDRQRRHDLDAVPHAGRACPGYLGT